MRKIFLLGIASLIMVQAEAAPNMVSQDSSYGIMGGTAGELREQMNLFRKQETLGNYDADTRWTIHWNYDFLKKDDSCELKRHLVKLEITYHLPQWLNEDSADTPLKHKWDRYLEHLRTHENGHARNGEKAAWEIEEMLNNLAPMPSCQLLKEVVNTRAQQILAEHNAWDQEYDKETNHGMSQGAVFP